MKQGLKLQRWSVFCLGILMMAKGYCAPFNGFDVNDALIPIEKIMQGGPPKDGIPAIDHPRFVTADQARFLKPEDRVIGVSVNGIHKAYPIPILNWHEVVNDRFNDLAVVVTFCPLCGTGVVYETGRGDQALEFGVSGLLYNSDVLLYDRGTESLWSQLKNQAVAGPLKGQRMKMLASQLIPWSSWIEQFPDTVVLSVNTGYRRDYSRNPYSGYENSRGLYFPVEFLSYKYHPKERVIGLEYRGVIKAYPIAELAKSGSEGRILDTVAGEQLTIDFNASDRNARIFTSLGEELAVVNAFWFAWYAFYPDSDVYSHDNQ
ncbi:MAG: DUF3179 domain-containing protein [Motiliproteus sp.]